MVKKFLRRTWKRYSKLGRKRKKKQTWRSPKGRHSKTREKRKGYPKIVSIGYKENEKIRKKPKVVRNIRELEKAQKDETIIIGNIGKKKKIEIVKRAKEIRIKISNLNIEKFLKKNLKRENLNKKK